MYAPLGSVTCNKIAMLCCDESDKRRLLHLQITRDEFHCRERLREFEKFHIDLKSIHETGFTGKNVGIYRILTVMSSSEQIIL